MKKIDNIGYVLNKKNTPYKYKMIDGDYVLSHGKPVLDNDLEDCLCEIMDFCAQRKDYRAQESIRILSSV